MKTIYFHCNFDKPEDLSNKVKSCIIENNLAEIISFESDKIQNFLPHKYSHELPDRLLIPTIFKFNNGSTYDGVEFALQWYFHLLNLKHNFSIVLLGIEDKGAFFEHCNYSHFAKCPNVFYVNQNISAIKTFIDSHQYLEYNIDNCIKSIKRIGIKAPTSYKSHHSITNEWSVYRWCNFLNIHNEFLDKLSNEINESLYYNYLKAIYPIEITSEPTNYKILKQGNILLIDDEIEKGWEEFFISLMTANQRFDSIGKDFKKKSIDDIVESSIEKVKNFNPDVVILDLRLHEDDFDNKTANELTGVKILKKIKDFNKGVQVLIFTASNKVWNYIELQLNGIDGFVLKESPEQSKERKFTQNAILNLKNDIEYGLDSAKFLKEIYYKSKECIEHIDELKKLKVIDKDFVGAIRTFLNLAFDSLINKKGEYQYDSSFMYYFFILEASSKQFIDEDNPICENDKYKFEFRKISNRLKSFNTENGVKTSYDYVSNNRRIDYNQKFYNLIDLAGLPSINPINLVQLRNDFNHPNLVENKRIALVKKENIKEVFLVCYKLLMSLS